MFDEMTIQWGLQLQPHNDGLDMFGYVDFGEKISGIANQRKPVEGIESATTAIQFVFLAMNGFRFPFAYIVKQLIEMSLVFPRMEELILITVLAPSISIRCNSLLCCQWPNMNIIGQCNQKSK